MDIARFGGVAAVVCASAVVAQGASVVDDQRAISAAAGISIPPSPVAPVSDSDTKNATFGSAFDEAIDIDLTLTGMHFEDQSLLGARAQAQARQVSSIGFPTSDSFVVTLDLFDVRRDAASR